MPFDLGQSSHTPSKRPTRSRETNVQSSFADVSVVIPSYNGKDVLLKALATLREVAPGAEIIVVDGSSTDGSADAVARQFKTARVLSVRNHGFAHATNRGMEVASRSFVLMHNSDVFVTRDAMEAMRSRLRDNPQLGATAPVLLNADGTRQHNFGLWYLPNVRAVRMPLRTNLLNAACLMTRRDVLEHIGGLDENLFLYNEEIDWCIRAERAGYALEMVPNRVVHLGGASTEVRPELAFEARRGFCYVMHKHFPGPIAEACRLAMQFQGWTWAQTGTNDKLRALWARQRDMMTDGNYLASAFPLSGRGGHRTNGIPQSRQEAVSEPRVRTPRLRPPVAEAPARVSAPGVVIQFPKRARA